jgi:hypothetical protein
VEDTTLGTATIHGARVAVVDCNGRVRDASDWIAGIRRARVSVVNRKWSARQAGPETVAGLISVAQIAIGARYACQQLRVDHTDRRNAVVGRAGIVIVVND